ncbi:MAG TPA: hypothetical protein DEB23_05410 [Chitinophagaceae bacterium]|jgi:hypothetical protein|nr:hypothetical protein [Chitinophagaceae bacterium]
MGFKHSNKKKIMSKNTLFISVQSIKDRTGLHANVDEKLVLPEIKTAQDMYILPALGSALYNELQTAVDTNTYTNLQTTLLDDYIVDTLIYFVMSELPQGLSFQFYNKGLLRKSGENQENPSMQDMIDVANRYKARAEFYKQRLIKYLKQNNALYPNYLNFGSGIDSIKPDNEGYTVSMYLGDACCNDDDYDGKRKRTFEERYQGNIGCC